MLLLEGLKSKLSTQDSNALFDQADLEKTLFRLETYSFNQDFEPLPGLKVRFINAGHVVGAACIYLRYGSIALLYTGNYNTTSSRTASGLRLKDLPQADILLTEGTCGADTNPARKPLETELLNEIAAVVQAGGNVLIPVAPRECLDITGQPLTTCFSMGHTDTLNEGCPVMSRVFVTHSVAPRTSCWRCGHLPYSSHKKSRFM